MTLPFMLRFARKVSAEPRDIPGRYDDALGLRVVDTADGPRALVDTPFEFASILTKTDAVLERDDEDRPQPPSPLSGGSGDSSSRHESSRLAESSLLTLLTKTAVRRESDDEGSL